MSKKQKLEIIKAMIATANLSPIYEDDYYENLNATSIAALFEGVTSYFKIDRNSWAFHFCNMGYMDTPSETLEFFDRQLENLIEQSQAK
jgi:hypothetical protein